MFAGWDFVSWFCCYQKQYSDIISSLSCKNSPLNMIFLSSCRDKSGGGENRKKRGCNPFLPPITSFPSPPEFPTTIYKKRAPSAGNALSFLPLTWVTFHPARHTSHFVSPRPCPTTKRGKGARFCAPMALSASHVILKSPDYMPGP